MSGCCQNGHQTARTVGHTIWRSTKCALLRNLRATSVNLCAGPRVQVRKNEVNLNRNNRLELTGGKLKPPEVKLFMFLDNSQ